MGKRILFLTISLLNFSTFAAESEEVAAINDRQSPIQSIMPIKLPLPKWYKESREAATRRMALYDFDSSKDKRMGTYECEAKFTQPAQAIAQSAKKAPEKALSAVADRRRRAKELRAASAAAAEASSSTTSKTTAYVAETFDSGISLEKDGPLPVACFAVLDCQDKLRVLGPEKICIVSDAGLCPCCGIIDNSLQIIHRYTVREGGKALHIPPIRMGDFRLDKKPNKWREEVQTHPDFKDWGLEQRAAAERIANTFCLIKEGTKNPTLLAQALRYIYQYEWECDRVPGIINDDGEILPPTN